MLIIIAVLAFLNILLIIYLGFSIFSKKRRIIDRMQNYLNPDKNKDVEEPSKNIPWREGLNAVGKSLGKSKRGSEYKEKTETNLLQAHLPLKAEEFIAMKAIICLGSLLVGYILSERLLLAAAIGILGFYLPDIYLGNRKRNILHKIDQQLPDTIVLISNSLKAGYSFLQAVDVASKELPEPISVEFGKIIKQINLGVSTESALEDFSKRVQSPDLELVILAVLIQRQIGGNLSEILDNISETIRSRLKIKGEVRILTAQGRVSGIIVSLVPVALASVMFIMNPDYIILMLHDPIGWAMIGASVFLQLLGIFSIKKIIKIEV